MSGSLQGKQLDGDFRQIFVLTRVNQRLRVILKKTRISQSDAPAGRTQGWVDCPSHRRATNTKKLNLLIPSTMENAKKGTRFMLPAIRSTFHAASDSI